jgi:stress response protein YsnF
LATQAAEADVIRFFVGTQSLKFDNQVHRVEVDEEKNAIHREVFLHKEGEVWHMASSFKDPAVLATCYNSVTRMFANA